MLVYGRPRIDHGVPNLLISFVMSRWRMLVSAGLKVYTEFLGLILDLCLCFFMVFSLRLS